MASTATPVSPPRECAAEGAVSLVRVYFLRAMYLLLVVGLGAMIVPEIVSQTLTSRGVIPSLLGAVWALAFLGLRYPLQMLPHPLGLCLPQLCEPAGRSLALGVCPSHGNRPCRGTA